jgi:PHP family Zn ribbon phosphoesterase
VLIDAAKDALAAVVDNEVAEAIVRVREGNIRIAPGYDGIYGQLVISDDLSVERTVHQRVQQSNLSDFM